MTEGFDPYYQWLGIPPKHQPPNHYRLLSIEEFEDNPDVIESAADRQMAHVRLNQTGPNAELSQEICNQIAAAKLSLLNPTKKAEYDAQLRADREVEEAAARPRKPRAVRDQRSVSRPQSSEAPTTGLPSQPAALPQVQSDAPAIRSIRRQRWPVWRQMAIGGTLLGVLLLCIIVGASYLINPGNGEGTGSNRTGPGRKTASTDPTKSKPFDPVKKKPVDPKPESKTPKDPPQQGKTKTKEATKKDGEDPANLSGTNAFEGARAGQEWDRNALKMRFCWCPPGRFTMGSPTTEPGRRPEEDQVDVTLTRGFWLGKYEVTQAQWEVVMGTQPWAGKPYAREGGDYAASYISWEDAVTFCAELTKKDRSSGKLPPDWDYRLPTEAQWEYACRAGSKTRYGFGDDDSRLGEYAWYRENAWNVGEKYAHRVGTKRSNSWGLHDIHGNVIEWCRDWFKKELPGGTDPEVTTKAAQRVHRGGSWFFTARNCRSAYRYGLAPGYRSNSVGFRVAAVQPLRSVENSGKNPANPSGTGTFERARAGQEWDGNALTMKFCWCPPGKFTMGSPQTEPGRRPGEDQVDVTLTRGFWLGKYEVTQTQWKAVMGTQPPEWGTRPDTKSGDDYPATFVTWNDAAKFCEELTKRERAAGRLPARWAYRLPTEAQWEYACRAGTETAYSFGDDVEQLGGYAWFLDNARNAGRAYAQQVAEKKPNPWGFHDIHGNVWEWCSDRVQIQANGFPFPAPGGTDPEGTQESSHRIRRGGSWYDSGGNCRSANRMGFEPSRRHYHLGFRVAVVQVSK